MSENRSIPPSSLGRIVVAVKQVPDTTQVRVDPEKGTLIREGIPFIVNPFDVHAVEEALRLKDRYGSHVTVITMGPPNADMTLRKCLSMGCDDAILISDRLFSGADTLATSLVLASAIKKIGQVDLVVCGKQTIDGDTGQVGPGIATRLEYSQLTLVEKIENIDTAGRNITVTRRLDGMREVVRSPLPALLTVIREINKPRYPTVQRKLSSEKAQLTVWSNAELGLDPAKLGLKGSPTNVKKIFAPVRARGEILGDGEFEPAGAVHLLIKKLIELDRIHS